MAGCVLTISKGQTEMKTELRSLKETVAKLPGACSLHLDMEHRVNRIENELSDGIKERLAVIESKQESKP